MENKKTDNAENISIHISSNLKPNASKIVFYDPPKTENTIVLQTTDPLSKSIALWRDTFYYHIFGNDSKHEDRSYLEKEENLKNIKNTLSRPTFIVTDKDNPERLNYIGVHIVTFSNEEKKIKPIIVVAEESNKGYTDLEVVTIMIKGSLNEKMHEQREVLYDINK